MLCFDAGAEIELYEGDASENVLIIVNTKLQIENKLLSLLLFTIRDNSRDSHFTLNVVVLT